MVAPSRKSGRCPKGNRCVKGWRFESSPYLNMKRVLIELILGVLLICSERIADSVDTNAQLIDFILVVLMLTVFFRGRVREKGIQ